MAPSTASAFAGEAFLTTSIPDPEEQYQFLTKQLQAILLLVLVVAPLALGRFFPAKDDDEVPVVVRWLPRLNLLGFVLAFGVVLQSPNNIFTARSVFVAPLFTGEECDSLLQRGHQAAQRNLEQFPNSTELARSPPGWRKERHEVYPTTDLNLVTDAFTKEDRQYLALKLHQRLAPLIHRIYGMVPASIRANDMFLVRYDAQNDTGGQQALAKHTDDSFVSFNILLNDDFEGGGTRFHNRRKQEDAAAMMNVHPPPGHVLLSNAVILHEGLPITKGTRYILVGFLQIDRHRLLASSSSGVKAPPPTGLSWFASWLSLPWAQVRFKQGHQAIARRLSGSRASTTTGDKVGDDDNNMQNDEQLQQQQQQQQPTLKPKWSDHDLTYHMFKTAAYLCELIGDVIAPHNVHWLVVSNNDDESSTAVNDYLAALDAVPMQHMTRRASWFQQQRFITDFDGSVVQRVDARGGGKRQEQRESSSSSSSSSQQTHDPRSSSSEL